MSDAFWLLVIYSENVIGNKSDLKYSEAFLIVLLNSDAEQKSKAYSLFKKKRRKIKSWRLHDPKKVNWKLNF